MASRRKSRERALQVLFLCDLGKYEMESAIEAYYFTLHSEDEDFSRLAKDRFMEELVRGAMGKRETLDEQIGKASEHWRIDRMPSVDRNILRLAAFELLENKLPYAVIIDEALELARRYSGNESVGFVNGVLDSIRASQGKAGVAAAAGASLPNTEG
jgi:N utilization substance protein B